MSPFKSWRKDSTPATCIHAHRRKRISHDFYFTAVPNTYTHIYPHQDNGHSLFDSHRPGAGTSQAAAADAAAAASTAGTTSGDTTENGAREQQGGVASEGGSAAAAATTAAAPEGGAGYVANGGSA